MNSVQVLPWKRQLIAVLLFGIAFGYVEATVVTYLRPQFDAIRARFYPQSSSDELFPLLSVQQVKAAGPGVVKLLWTELGREGATMVMLTGVAAAVGSSFAQGFAFLLIVFGTWDIFYYVFLKVLNDWPKSLMAWDILFLLPVPWTGPVLAPVLVSLAMVGAGIIFLWRESNRHPIRLKAAHWLCAIAAGLIIVASFIWDARNVMAGGMPKPFNWPLFTLGAAVGLFAFLHALGAGQGTRKQEVEIGSPKAEVRSQETEL